jgi:hypothetical protein
MTAITYTAKRNMQATGVAVVAQSDIAANLSGSPQVGTFDSTASPATDLSVFTDTYWIKSEGFTNSANNGWFGINGTPTTIQITLDNATLSTEAAGNDITLTEYYRGVGQSYDLETNSQSVTMPSDSGIRQESIALSGVRETLFFRRRRTYNVQTGVITSTDFPQWQEFFASVMGGESFTFDAYGTIASPDNPISVYLVGDPTYSRIENFTEYFISFQVEAA